MKMFQRLAFMISVFFACSSGQAQFAADSLVHKLFASLKNNDEKAFRALYPGVLQIVRISRRSTEKLLNLMLSHSGESKEMLLLMTDNSSTKDAIKGMNLDSLLKAEWRSVPDDIEKKLNSPEGKNQVKQSFSEAFKKMVTVGEKKGVDWQNVKFLSFTIDDADPIPIKRNRMWGELFAGSAAKSIGGVIDFRAGKINYKARVQNIFYVPEDSCWFGGEITEVIQAGEKFTGLNPTNFSPARRASDMDSTSAGSIKVPGELFLGGPDIKLVSTVINFRAGEKFSVANPPILLPSRAPESNTPARIKKKAQQLLHPPSSLNPVRIAQHKLLPALFCSFLYTV